MEAEIGNQVLDRTEKFAIMNKHLNNVYNGEDEETKAEIHLLVEEERKAKDVEREQAKAIVKVDEELGPKEYLMYVNLVK